MKTFTFENGGRDPVFYLEGDENVGDAGWYFWDETWVNFYGPYDTQEEARGACVQYAETI